MYRDGSDGGFDLGGFVVLLQQAVGGMTLAGPLQWMSQQLGHTVVQLKGRPSQCHLILVAGALGIQAAHEGKHVLWGRGGAVQPEDPLMDPLRPWKASRRRGHQGWVLKDEEDFSRKKQSHVQQIFPATHPGVGTPRNLSPGAPSLETQSDADDLRPPH